MAPPLKPLDPPAELPAGAKLHPRELAKAFAKIKIHFFSFVLASSVRERNDIFSKPFFVSSRVTYN
jgi:hypothetical protein